LEDPFSKRCVTPSKQAINRPFGKGITPVRGRTNHGYESLAKWDEASKQGKWRENPWDGGPLAGKKNLLEPFERGLGLNKYRNIILYPSLSGLYIWH